MHIKGGWLIIYSPSGPAGELWLNAQPDEAGPRFSSNYCALKRQTHTAEKIEVKMAGRDRHQSPVAGSQRSLFGPSDRSWLHQDNNSVAAFSPSSRDRA